MKKKKIILACCMILIFNAINITAQTQVDTLKLISYNVGNYGFPQTNQCPLLNLTYKNAYLTTIIQYEQPDIIGMSKMLADPTFCNTTVITDALNNVCNGCWGHGTYSVVSGYGKENMLYFNTNRLGFVSSTVIYSADNNISDITLHKLYYKSTNLSTTHDTVFINIVLAHLVSGGGNDAQRGTEVAGAMTWLNAHFTSPANLIFMGDLNTTTSSETCFQDMLNSVNANTRFYDPPNQLGAWSNNPSSFADYLTQSTRTSDPGDCNATGGLNNRFDHILVTNTIMQGTDSALYIPGSYKVVGQDGLHTGNALIDPPTNISVPGNVDSALYYMSEHLPVALKLAITYPLTTGIENDFVQNLSLNYTSVIVNNLIIQPIKDKTIADKYTHCKAQIYDLQGRIISDNTINLNQLNTIDESGISDGIYFLRLINDNTPLFIGKFIKLKE